MLEKIDKDLVPIKAHYFLYSAATGPLVQFLPTIAKQLGFSGFLVGSIYTILPISGLVAKPLFGGLADRFHLHKFFFLLFQAILAIAFFSIQFISEIDRQESTNVTMTCDKAATFLEVCSKDGFTDETLKKVIDTIDTNSHCQLSCKATERIYGELCFAWTIGDFCFQLNDVTDGTRFNFTAIFNMNDDLKLKNCVNIRLRNATFSSTVAHSPFCEQYIRTSCLISCPDVPEMRTLLAEARGKNETSIINQTSTYQFHLFLWAAIISWVGMAVVVSIADAICFDLLGEGRQKEYGKQRMWSSIGFGIFCISTGYLVDVLSRGELNKDYTCIFYIMLIAMLFDMIVSATLKKKNQDCTEYDPSVFWELNAVAREGRVLVFAFWCVGAGMCTGVVWNFLLFYTEDLVTEENRVWLKTIQGLVTGVQCFLGELPFNFLSGRVLKKLGHINVMSLVLLIYAARFMAYSLVKNLWMFLIIEILHGPTLGLCWPTMVSYGDKVAPSGTRATMQGFVGAVFEGIGVSSGSLICGWLMDSYGGVVCFRIFSVGALVWLTAYWILQLLLRKAKAYPLHQGHSHLASYATPSEAIYMTTSQELQTY